LCQDAGAPPDDKENTMPNFLYIFRGGGMNRQSPQELQQQMQKWGAWIQQLRQDGQFKAGEPLETSGKVVRGKKKAVTDGPYAEAKDLVGGFLLVEAANLDEATELSRGCPVLDVDGTVEIRAIASMSV
jgi:hypothetical protein